jgi:hypothetical protein
MPTSKKRFTSTSPRKVQTEMTAFTGKRIDNKSTPTRSYAQAASANRFEALSDEEYDDDEEMEDALSEESDTTPKQVNAKVANESNKSPLSKKALRKLAKESRKTANDSLNDQQPRFISSATKATLERSRRAKGLLLSSSNTPQDIEQALPANSTQENEEASVKNSDKDDEELVQLR